MQELLERAVPGNSKAVRRMREQILDIAGSFTAKAMLLRGPIGGGKSTIARLLALLKRVAPLAVPNAERLLDDVRFDGPNRVDLKYMVTWYVELALTGLVESLAEMQLFGAVKGAYTDAREQRIGVFERAMTGGVRAGDRAAGARLTGGVVFLDEIGDLSPNLQAKLLPVLSGGVFYRIGGEGNPAHALQFSGTTIAATWKDIEAGLLRPDLISRVAAYIIDVPGMDEREGDFDLMFDAVESALIGEMKKAIEDADRVEPLLDREYWRSRKESITPVSADVRRLLAKVQWGKHGNLRGLTAALEQILATNAPPERVIEELPTLVRAESPDAAGLLPRLFERTPDGQGLAGHVRAIEVEQRRDLRDNLLGDLRTRQMVAHRLGLSERQLLTQIQQLDRRRQQARKEKPQ
jgi:DNA-binding NtrC family response regulator